MYKSFLCTGAAFYFISIPIVILFYQKSVAKTAELIAAGETVIYEAAFQFEGVLCAIDILIKQDGYWYAYEVKGSTSAKETFIQDAALQYFVITNSGLDLKDIFILHLNNKYVRYGELDLQQLFTATSILNQVMALQDFIAEKIKELKNILLLNDAPNISIGSHCSKPYDCNFYGYCSKGIEENNDDADYGKPIIEKEAVEEFIEQLTYPICHIDFETWMTAVPEQDGHWSYRQIPFQFSVHKQKTDRKSVV